MPRLPMPTDTAEFSDETRAAMRHILQTRTTIPPPSSYLTYAGKAGALLSDLVEHLRYHTSLTDAETEIAICTAVRAANLDYIWDAHVKLGLQAGVREEARSGHRHPCPLRSATKRDHPLRVEPLRYARSMTRLTQSARTSATRVARAGPPDGRSHHERDHPARHGPSADRAGPGPAQAILICWRVASLRARCC